MQGDYVRTQLLVTYVVTQQQSIWLPLIYNYLCYQKYTIKHKSVTSQVYKENPYSKNLNLPQFSIIYNPHFASDVSLKLHDNLLLRY